jgi:Mg-chelatase subunit ChlD
MKAKILGTSIEESKKQAGKEINSILEKILTSGSPKEPAHIKEGLTRMTSSVQPDNNIANQLARTFERVRQSKRQRLSETGSELDIEALIQTHSKGFGEYMLEEVRHKGLTIYVSIDGSGSMRHMNHMGEARTLVATMFKAVEKIPSVRILANVWSSNTQGEVGITTVKTLGECKQISLDGKGYYYTPTHEAIRYTAKQMGNYSGKKLMIIITDGIPQYHKEGQSFSNEVLINMAQKEYRKAQKYCRNIMCINISNEGRSKENLQQIFKRNYVEFNGMIQAKQFVLKNFRRTVFDTLRR